MWPRPEPKPRRYSQQVGCSRKDCFRILEPLYICLRDTRSFRRVPGWGLCPRHGPKREGHVTTCPAFTRDSHICHCRGATP